MLPHANARRLPSQFTTANCFQRPADLYDPVDVLMLVDELSNQRLGRRP